MLRIGIDLERIERFNFYGRPDRQAFYRRVYTPTEQAAFGLDAIQLALCFTAKEAVSKALGTGLTLGEPGSVSCLDIEVSCPSGSIQPKVNLTGYAALVAQQLNLTEVGVCWYHDQRFACAIAMGAILKTVDLQIALLETLDQIKVNLKSLEVVQASCQLEGF